MISLNRRIQGLYVLCFLLDESIGQNNGPRAGPGFMDLRCIRAGPGRAYILAGRAGPGKNMRSYQRAGPVIENNGPGRVGPALCGPCRSLVTTPDGPEAFPIFIFSKVFETSCADILHISPPFFSHVVSWSQSFYSLSSFPYTV